VVSGDGSANQRVCVHGVAKLVNLLRGSKLDSLLEKPA
jgi:hypothetical protein